MPSPSSRGRCPRILHSCKRKLTHKNISNVISALNAVMDAAAFSSVDKQKLVALVKSRQASDDDDDSELSALAAAAYVSHSSDIVDVLKDLLDKAEAQLDEIRHAELNVAHNFALLKQSLEDQLAQDNKALEKAKADRVQYIFGCRKSADLLEAEKSLVAVQASDAACAGVKGFVGGDPSPRLLQLRNRRTRCCR